MKKEVEWRKKNMTIKTNWGEIGEVQREHGQSVYRKFRHKTCIPATPVQTPTAVVDPQTNPQELH